MHIELEHFAGDLWPVGALALALLLVAAWRRTRRPAWVAVCAAFGVYLLFAIDIVFFPIRAGTPYFEGFGWSVNLIPLNFDFSELPNVVLMQILQNVLLTVPLGFGIRLMVPVSPRRAVWLALAVGFSTEALQLMIGLLLGYPYRIIDVNDLLLNALGVLVGYAGFRAAARLYATLRRTG
jgi:glycopeptide antibiotics resistance protein